MISKKLFPLALGGLGIGTTEFVIMGLLPDVANSLSVSIPQAGNIIHFSLLDFYQGCLMGHSSGWELW